MSPRRDRERAPARKGAVRDPRPVILIFCEGSKTEPDYFRSFRDARVRIQIAGERGVPLTLVTAARDALPGRHQAARQAGDTAYEQVWCVCDVDDHPQLPEALDMARANGIEVALSNPCFELWLYLHLREPPGEEHRHSMQRKLAKVLPDYDKSLTAPMLATLHDGLPHAIRRARQLDARASPGAAIPPNPTTGVYRLVEAIQPSPGRSP